MIDTAKFNQQVEDLEQMLRDKLGLRGKSLSARLKKAGRRLPKRIHKAGRVVSRAQATAAHPKLARLTDQKAVDTAFASISAHLKTLDPGDRRKGLVLGVLGGMVFNLILLVLAVLAILRWQGVI